MTLHTAFNFKVRLLLDGEQDPFCECAFSEVSGLESSMEVQTIREGGNNTRQIHLPGPVTYGQLTLKRGMSEDIGLWQWFARLQTERHLRASGEVVMLSSDRETEALRYVLTGCLPTKIAAPTLSALDGAVAIEEMQLAYETMELAAG